MHAEEPEALRDAAFGWLTDGIREYDKQADLRMMPEDVEVSVEGFSRAVDAVPWRSRGGPWGRVHVSPQGSFDVLYNPYTADALPWLERHLSEQPESASVRIGHVAESGAVEAPDTSFCVSFEEEVPGYVKLGFHVGVPALVAPFTTIAEHEGLLAAVRWACDRYNMVFGHVSYRRSGGATELEGQLRGRPSDPVLNMPYWRTLLRGYSWLMVIPDSIAEVLGGSEALRSTGAFASVAVLPNNAVLLQATPTFQQYDREAVKAVHRVVRDVLVQGELRDPPSVPGPPTDLVVVPTPGAGTGAGRWSSLRTE